MDWRRSNGPCAPTVYFVAPVMCVYLCVCLFVLRSLTNAYPSSGLPAFLRWCVRSCVPSFLVLCPSDVLLDAEDSALSSRGAILDVEGQAILLKLETLGAPTFGVGAVDGGDGGGGGEQTTAVGDGDGISNGHGHAVEKCRGWGAVEGGVKRAISLRCASGKRARYAAELSDELRCLEEAR